MTVPMNVAAGRTVMLMLVRSPGNAVVTEDRWMRMSDGALSAVTIRTSSSLSSLMLSAYSPTEDSTMSEAFGPQSPRREPLIVRRSVVPFGRAADNTSPMQGRSSVIARPINAVSPAMYRSRSVFHARMPMLAVPSYSTLSSAMPMRRESLERIPCPDTSVSVIA